METIIGTVTTVAGVELTVKKDQHHFRAYDKDGKQHGAAWMDCENLANELRFKMPEIGPAPEIPAPPAADNDGGPDKPESSETPTEDTPQAESADAAGPILIGVENYNRSRCGHFNEEVCRMDNTTCDGKCGEHASRAPGSQDDGYKPNIEG